MTVKDIHDGAMRRITKPKPVTIYNLRNWDGADGRGNSPSGFLTESLEIAKQWKESATGRDFYKVEGTLISAMEQIPEAQEYIDRQKALAKLTDKEKQLLGLS